MMQNADEKKDCSKIAKIVHRLFTQIRFPFLLPFVICSDFFLFSISNYEMRLHLILMMTGKPAGKQKYPCCLIYILNFARLMYKLKMCKQNKKNRCSKVAKMSSLKRI